MTRLLATVGIGIIALIFFYHSYTAKERGTNRGIISPSKNISPTVPSPLSSLPTQSIFVPYWSISGEELDVDTYDELIYFGVTADKNGIDKKETGYTRIDSFLQRIDVSKKKVLCVRMLNNSLNSAILEDKNWQKTIISDAVFIAKENSFNGILLDFEISALSFPSVVKNITEFHRFFYQEVKKNNLLFSVAVYGDSFYRARPYDIQTISQNADRIYVLAYDFHKAREDPGPNFPLAGEEKYGYDLVRMLDDFKKVVDRQKLVIVFGMFGYDWKVDDENKALETASPLSFFALKQKFIDSCQLQDCVVARDIISSETKVQYVDDAGLKHMVWFEDEESVKKKKGYLKDKGIQSVGFWAYSYF